MGSKSSKTKENHKYQYLENKSTKETININNNDKINQNKSK